MALESARTDEIEALLSGSIDRKFRPDSAVFRQKMTQRQPADLLRNSVCQDGIQPFLGFRSRHLVFGEGRHVEQSHILEHIAAFIADMVEIIRSPERPLLLDLAVAIGWRVIVAEQHVLRLIELLFRKPIAWRREPSRPLPPINRAEDGTELFHPVIARCPLQRPRFGALLIWVMRR